MNAIETAIERFKKGNFVIVLDSKDRENEGDLVLAAQDATASKINFMITYGRGLVCVPMSKKRLKELKLPIMVQKNEESAKCIFTISCDARNGITTGISASDRAKTIRLLADSQTTSSDFVRPGHIFPLRGSEGGLKSRQGHTEASLELCRLSGKSPCAVICEILNSDGTMARLKQLKAFSKKYDIALIFVEELTTFGGSHGNN